MKIRHKQSGVVLEGQFTECSNSLLGWPLMHYFMSKDTCSQYDMREWEEVKPEWVDVTGECPGINLNRLLQRQWGSDMRLRKVHISDMEADMRKHAFIIEKRQA